MKEGGDTLTNQTVLVIGTLPKLGRKNLFRLIESYGGELLMELRKTTSLVVGDDLGSKKLDNCIDVRQFNCIIRCIGNYI